ncbi:hypothetical protein GCM10007362_25140 [Saccharibacillus endophyticus]|uniref:Uncharacterized protein n=1 Tax=Saccharibacillus endophyticus TaxID=2060666 RepID=A0ABQ1ZX84_9BACL|nr:hypothetical protein GCM10007362_25140 [Saccharibacillus endophyticus]
MTQSGKHSLAFIPETPERRGGEGGVEMFNKRRIRSGAGRTGGSAIFRNRLRRVKAAEQSELWF